jgi:HPt (histidine-containing phosphotransfer) domain-containing protein
MSDSINLNKLHPIDFGEVLNRIGGDTSFLKELLDIYFSEYAEKRRLLNEAITRQDFTEVGNIGHSLKGASANLSLTRLLKVALLIESAGREKKLQSAQDAACILELEIQTLKDFLARNRLEDLP